MTPESIGEPLFEKNCPKCSGMNIIQLQEYEDLFVCEDCGYVGFEDDF